MKRQIEQEQTERTETDKQNRAGKGTKTSSFPSFPSVLRFLRYLLFISSQNLAQPREAHGAQLGDFGAGLQRRGNRNVERVFAIELDVDVLLFAALLSGFNRQQVAVLLERL